MAWSEQQWQVFEGLVAGMWPGEFPEATSNAWRFALRSVEPHVAEAALDRLLHRGQTFRPSAAEYVAACIEVERGATPSFDEVWPAVRLALSGRWRRKADGQVGFDNDWCASYLRERVGDVAAGWAALYSFERLSAEQVDGEYGGAVLHRLRDCYAQHVEDPSAVERGLRALERADWVGVGSGELRRLDPWAGLDGDRLHLVEDTRSVYERAEDELRGADV